MIFGLSLENTTTFISIANDDYCTFSPFPLTEAFPVVAVPSFSTSTIAITTTTTTITTCSTLLTTVPFRRLYSVPMTVMLSLASQPYFSSCACALGRGAGEGKEKYVW